MTHSPTPWKFTIRPSKEGECGPGLWIQDAYGNTVIDTGNLSAWACTPRDYAHLVRAVNCHDALLATCKEVRALIKLQAHGGITIDFQDKLKDLEAAIAKAEV